MMYIWMRIEMNDGGFGWFGIMGNGNRVFI